MDNNSLAHTKVQFTRDYTGRYLTGGVPPVRFSM